MRNISFMEKYYKAIDRCLAKNQLGYKYANELEALNNIKSAITLACYGEWQKALEYVHKVKFIKE